MRNVKNKWRNVVAIAICLATTVLFSGCGQDDPNSPDGPDNNSFDITGQIVNHAGYDIATVKMTDNAGEWTVASAPVQNGNFTITLPATVEDSRLKRLVDDMGDGMTLSNPNAKFVSISEGGGLTVYDSKEEEIDRLICVSDDESAGIIAFIYADGNCEVAGTIETATYNMDLKKGWNVIYCLIDAANGNMEYTTVVPDKELKWLLATIEIPNPPTDPNDPPIDPNQAFSGHISGDCTDVMGVLFYYGYDADEEYYVTAPVDTEKDNLFVLELPKTLDSKFLYRLAEEAPATMQLSDVNTLFANGFFEVVYPNNTFHSLYYMTKEGEVEGLFMYADRPCNITGSDQEQWVDERGESIKTSYIYNVQLAKGWNIVYSVFDFDGNDEYVTVTSTQPDVVFEWIQSSDMYLVAYRLPDKGKLFFNR
jgi:hypothetical protein